MKRLAIRLVLLLLLGAIVNVAVAWGLELVIHVSEAQPIAAIQIDDRVLRSVVCRSRGATMSCLSTWMYLPSPLIYETELTIAEAIPAWFPDHPEPPEMRARTTFETSNSIQAHAYGWPALSLFWARYSCGPPPQQVRFEGIFIKGRRVRPILPCNAIWPGFAINTIFYAAVLWVLFATPGFMKRRIRRGRGRCIHCGYDLRGQPPGSKTCPECGRNGSPKS